MQPARNTSDVIFVVGTEFHLDKPTRGRMNDTQLPTAIEGPEPAIAVGRQAEIGVVVLRFIDIRYRDRDGGETV